MPKRAIATLAAHSEIQPIWKPRPVLLARLEMVHSAFPTSCARFRRWRWQVHQRSKALLPQRQLGELHAQLVQLDLVHLLMRALLGRLRPPRTTLVHLGRRNTRCYKTSSRVCSVGRIGRRQTLHHERRPMGAVRQRRQALRRHNLRQRHRQPRQHHRHRHRQQRLIAQNHREQEST